MAGFPSTVPYVSYASPSTPAAPTAAAHLRHFAVPPRPVGGATAAHSTFQRAFPPPPPPPPAASSSVHGRSFSHPPLPHHLTSAFKGPPSTTPATTEVPEEQKRRFESFTRQLMSAAPAAPPSVSPPGPRPAPPQHLHSHRQPSPPRHPVMRHSLPLPGMRQPEGIYPVHQQRESSVR